MRTTDLLLIFLIAPIVGCSALNSAPSTAGVSSPPTSTEVERALAETPVLFATRPPNMDVNNSGLRIVLWDDGLIVLPTPDRPLGDPLLVGWITPQEVRLLLERLESLGYFNIRSATLFPVEMPTQLYVRQGEKLYRREWDEARLPSHSQIPSPSREFVAMWDAAWAAIDAIRPAEMWDAALLGPGFHNIRGLKLDGPLGSDWLMDAEPVSPPAMY